MNIERSHSPQNPPFALIEDYDHMKVVSIPTSTAERLEKIISDYAERLQRDLRRNELVKLKPFPRYLNQKEVISYLRHEKVFSILEKEYGLKPIRQEHKCSIYCAKQVEDKCIHFERNIDVERDISR